VDGWIKQLNKAWAVDVTGHDGAAKHNDSLREQKTAAWLVVFFSRGSETAASCAQNKASFAMNPVQCLQRPAACTRDEPRWSNRARRTRKADTGAFRDLPYVEVQAKALVCLDAATSFRNHGKNHTPSYLPIIRLLLAGSKQ